MEILHEFGFDIKLFIAQIVNFLLIAYIFKRFLYKSLLSTLKKRQELIEKGLKDAEKAGRALESAEDEQNKILEKASAEAENIINEAKKQSLAAREEIMNQTKANIDKLMQQTKEQIAVEKENFLKDSRETALEISRAILTEAVTNMFDKKEQAEIVKKGIEKLKK